MKKVLLMLILGGVAGVPQAQEISRTGTSAAQFLKLGAGARAAALGDAFVAFSGDVSSLYWNPAGAAGMQRRTLQVSYGALYLDLSYGFVGYIEPLGGLGILGLQACYLHAGEMEITTLQEPNGTGEFYNIHSLAMGLSYARALTDRLAVGMTAKFVQEGIYNETAQALAFDGGVQFATGLFGTTLGVCLSNFGGKLQMHGEDLWVDLPTVPGQGYGGQYQLRTERWPLPASIRLGAMTELLGPGGQLATSANDRLLVGIDFVDANDAPIRANLGAEYCWRQLLALRLGYHSGYDTPRLSLGGGLHYRLSSWSLQLDYAFVDYKDLGGTNRFTIGVAF
ncbi:MAG: PorV/PorQ family protein [candidate division KSB1 bacterium]|nr:PorV/PorQ family protein [candidate division KSB1 bacterium]MDZ7391331.1 PorV/PorQ family protein [candidate division KSB1 bacterium]